MPWRLATSSGIVTMFGGVFSWEKIPVVKAIGLAVLLASLASVASAGQTNTFCKFDPKIDKLDKFDKFCLYSTPPAEAPEIDPSSAMAGLTLLAAGLAVLRGRCTKISED